MIRTRRGEFESGVYSTIRAEIQNDFLCQTWHKYNFTPCMLYTFFGCSTEYYVYVTVFHKTFERNEITFRYKKIQKAQEKTLLISPITQRLRRSLKKWGYQTFISKFSNKNRQKFQKNFVCSLCFDDNFWTKNASVFNKKKPKSS